VARIHSVFLALSLALSSIVPCVSLLAQAVTPGTEATAPLELRPGDVIRLKVWREPDFSGDYPIDESGIATFPRLGPLRVAAFTADSLKQTLVASYAAYLVNPSIEVTALRRVNVLGAVRNPGLYQVDPTVTVADAIALAGGVTDNGRSNQVELVRGGKRLPANLDSSARLADTPIRSGDQLFVPQRGWLSRNVGVVAAGISAIGLVTAAAIRN
jgi:polysaccharide export outer membrane protein